MTALIKINATEQTNTASMAGLIRFPITPKPLFATSSKNNDHVGILSGKRVPNTVSAGAGKNSTAGMIFLTKLVTERPPATTSMHAAAIAKTKAIKYNG